MSSDENENENENDFDNNNANMNNNQNIDELTKLTNFSFGQISNFRKYFRKCKLKSDNKSSDLLNKKEFKNSLGVLSTRSCDYISNRLFQVISGENSEYLSFREYILYLDLVNYGSKEDKLKHCFKFFDIGNKGFITNKDFTTILYNLCLFLSSLTISQILVSESELSTLYEHYISKARIRQLDFQHFKILLNKFPSFLDFYDIFNNNIYYEMNFLIKKEQMEKLISIKDKISDLKNLINLSQIKNSSVSLVTEEYIDDVIEQQKDIGNISSISLETKNNDIDNNNLEMNYINCGLSDYLLFSRAGSEIDNKSNVKSNNTFNNKPIKDKKMFIPPFPKDATTTLMCQFNKIIKNNNYLKIQKKNEESNEDTSFDLSESSIENDNLDNSCNSLCKNNSISLNSTKKKKGIFKDSFNEKENIDYYNIKKLKKKNSAQSIVEVLEKKKKKFHFLKPFTNIRDEKLSSQLKRYGYDLNNILILTNKGNFQAFIDDLISSLSNLINSILPDQMKSKKRQGINLGENFEFDLGKMKKVKVSQDNEIQKNIIHFGNPNLKTVINIMIGIKSAVSKIGEIPIK